MITIYELETEIVKNEMDLRECLENHDYFRAFELKLQRDLLKQSLIDLLKQVKEAKKGA